MPEIPSELKVAAVTTSPQPPEYIVTDILIIGSGPVGCTFARKLVEANAGLDVIMVDAGAQLTQRPGEHLKNSFLYQRNIDLFASVIRGHLSPLSVPADKRPNLTLDPGAFDAEKPFIRNGQNPDQDPRRNLPAAAVTYAVGGMATHWTCATPRQHPEIERWNVIENWDALYEDAEELLHVHPRKNRRVHPFEHSVRHQLVLGVLKHEFSELSAPYDPQNLPLACERRTDNPEFVHWTGSDTILAPLIDRAEQYKGRLRILQQHRCRLLVTNSSNTTILGAIIDNLMEWKTIAVTARCYIVAAGAVLTPQILFNSGICPPPLGMYLSEQPMAFCQVVLKQALIDHLGQSPHLDEKARERIRTYRQDRPYDPIPIPMTEPEPQVWIPISRKRPWHCQIHRDAFQYGDVGPNVDARVIVDLRWFGIVDQSPRNKVSFSRRYPDSFGMPQPTFEFSYNSLDERNVLHTMMDDMVRAARTLGGFLSPSEPQFMSPGLALHIHGTTRMGTRPDDSVVDRYSRVWGFDNLVLGGNGLHPVSNASNPTLTSVAIAIEAANAILRSFE